jgi:hypothetical protein
MKIFYYEEENDIESIFLMPEYEIPFLGSDLFNFSKSAFERLAFNLQEKVEFFVPKAWNLESINTYNYNILEHLNEEPELVFITSVYSIFFSEMDKEYIQHLKQNKGNAFASDGTICSYISNTDELKEPKEDASLKVFFHLNSSNFLRTNQKLVSRIFSESVEVNSNIFGEPIILSSKVVNSTICGPSFIGPEVSVANSYIAPGSIILGDSSVSNSKVFSSFLYNSKVEKCEVDSIISSHSFVSGVNLKNSLIPSGGLIHNEG